MVLFCEFSEVYFNLSVNLEKSLVLENFKTSELPYDKAQSVKNLPAKQKAQVWSLSQKDPLDEEMLTHSSILAWEIPWTVEPGGLQSTELQRIGYDLVANQYTNLINTIFFQDLKVFGMYLVKIFA